MDDCAFQHVDGLFRSRNCVNLIQLTAGSLSESTKFIAYNNTLINLSAAIAPFVGNLATDLLGIKGALLTTAAVRAAGAVAFAWFCGLIAQKSKKRSGSITKTPAPQALE